MRQNWKKIHLPPCISWKSSSLTFYKDDEIEREWNSSCSKGKQIAVTWMNVGVLNLGHSGEEEEKVCTLRMLEPFGPTLVLVAVSWPNVKENDIPFTCKGTPT